jgi:hypothetical protein
MRETKSIDDGLIAEFFAPQVFALLLREELISQALVEKKSGWRHSDNLMSLTGFRPLYPA